VVEGTAELLTDTSLSIMRANPAIEEKYAGWLQLSQEAGSVAKDQDWQAIFGGYSQPIRVTPTRFLIGGAMQSIII
jgi:hypothetical protein